MNPGRRTTRQCQAANAGGKTAPAEGRGSSVANRPNNWPNSANRRTLSGLCANVETFPTVHEEDPMRITGAFALSLSLGAAVAVASAASHAKGAAKKGGGGSAPTASSAEVNKLKAVRLGDPKAGTFKWGMKPEEVMAQVRTSVEAKYEPRIDKARQDPGLQQRIRDEMVRELTAVKKSYTKFEGQKTGWDVSIVGPEFQQNTGGSRPRHQGRRLDPLLLLLRGRALQDVPRVQQGRHRRQELPGVRQGHGGEVRQRARGLSRRQDRAAASTTSWITTSGRRAAAIG